MKEVFSRKVKRRGSFRRIAPLVLPDATAEWFETTPASRT
jgi:predicted NodU family carbamoyl transferase